MKIGYARVSTDEQTLALQLDALRADGCEVVHEDHGVSGTAAKRPGLTAALAALKPGDVLTVWRVDRLGRSTASLALLLDDLHGRGVEFRSIMDGMDTSTASGRAVYGVISVMAQLERDLISERTKAGLRAAKRRGKRAGRPVALTPEKRDMALKLIDEGTGRGIVARMVGVSPATLRRSLNESAAK
jgi:DNA invertase Pin-like site-specific DNA recombinase